MAARMDDARIMQFLLSGMNTGCAQSARMNDFACDAVNRDARLMAHAPVRRHGGLAANQDVRNSRLVRTSARDDLSQVMGSTPSVHPTIGHHLSLNEGAAAARVAAADEAPAAAPAAAAAAAAAPAPAAPAAAAAAPAPAPAPAAPALSPGAEDRQPSKLLWAHTQSPTPRQFQGHPSLIACG